MSIKLERKFCLDSQMLLSKLQEEGLRPDHIFVEKFYTKIESKNIEYFYSDSKKIVKIVRQDEELKQEEAVSKDIYDKAHQNALGHTLKIERYFFWIQGFKACIDCYQDSLDELVLLKIEFLDKNSADNFTLPGFISAKDITHKNDYSDINLALYGVPEGCLEFEDELLRANMPGSDAFRIIFYEKLLNIEYFKNLYLKSNKKESLHKFRVNLRKTISLLEGVDDLFDEKITKYFIKQFKILAKASGFMRDLDLFELFLENLEPTEILKSQVDCDIDKQKKTFEIFLNSQEVESLLSEWRVVLEDDEGFFKSVDRGLSYRLLGAVAIKNQIDTICNNFTCLDEFSSIDEYHKVRIDFKRLRYILDELKALFDSNEFLSILKKTKKMQRIFGNLQDRELQKKALLKYENSEGVSEDLESVAFIEDILVEISYDMYKFKKSILDKKERTIEVLSNISPIGL